MKYSLLKAKVYDCEHEGDLRAEVSLITEVIKPYGGKIGNHQGEPWYWDGVDNGEAYIYFMIPEEHVDEVKKDIYCQEMGIIYDEVTKKAIETSKKQFVSTLYKKLLDYEKQDIRSLRSLAKECKWECSEQELMQLYISSLLQQATTVLMAMCSHPMLYISSLLQQATTLFHFSRYETGCIYLLFFNKPQHPVFHLQTE